MKTSRTIESNPMLRPWSPSSVAAALFVAIMVGVVAVASYVHACADIVSAWPR